MPEGHFLSSKRQTLKIAANPKQRYASVALTVANQPSAVPKQVQLYGLGPCPGNRDLRKVTIAEQTLQVEGAWSNRPQDSAQVSAQRTHPLRQPLLEVVMVR